MRSRWRVASAIAGLLLSGLGTAQQPGPSTASPAKPYILHAYANLVQIPALILGRYYQPLSPLPKSSIVIRLDSGPPFHPTHMHIEGKEPISLALLIDASGDQERLIKPLAVATGQMVAASLSQQDHISVYAVDCAVVGVGLHHIATPQAMQESVATVLAAPTLHHGAQKGTCGRTLALWDAASVAIRDLSAQSGYRVLMMITAGDDRKSINNWNAVRIYAGENSVAIFGVRDLIHYEGDTGLTSDPGLGAFYFGGAENPYTLLCENSGGLLLTTSAHYLIDSLDEVIDMVRGRYILEFPRPDDVDPGRHRIDVSVPSESTYITTAGVAFAPTDLKEEDDPTTVPSSPSPAIMGKRKPLPPP